MLPRVSAEQTAPCDAAGVLFDGTMKNQFVAFFARFNLLTNRELSLPGRELNERKSQSSRPVRNCLKYGTCNQAQFLSILPYLLVGLLLPADSQRTAGNQS